MGSDYKEGVARHGLRSSIKLFSQYKTIDEVISVMSCNMKHRSSLGPKALSEFKKIVCLFLFQTVFDPFTNELVSLSKNIEFPDYYELMKQKEMGEYFDDFVDFCSGKNGINMDKTVEKYHVLEDMATRYRMEAQFYSGDQLARHMEQRRASIIRNNTNKNVSTVNGLFEEFMTEAKPQQKRKKPLDISKFFHSKVDRQILTGLTKAIEQQEGGVKPSTLLEISRSYRKDGSSVEESVEEAKGINLLGRTINFHEEQKKEAKNVMTRMMKKEKEVKEEVKEVQTNLTTFFKNK